MGEQRGRALYSFSGQEDQNELSFQAGDEVVVFRQDIGDGWWEGQINGKVGLFPESYIELADADSGEDWDDEQEEWEDRGPGASSHGHGHGHGGGGGMVHLGKEAQESTTDPSSSSPPKGASAGGTTAAVASGSAASGSGPSFYDNHARATLRRSVNIFSGYVNSGAENFLRGSLKELPLDRTSMQHIANTPDGLVWVGSPQPLGPIAVSFDGKRKKFNGMKTFEAFKVAGGSKNGAVERRYKHFQWLHERLQEKYSCLCVPPMPDRQFMSRFGETPIDKRQVKLQQWLNRVARHPVLARDERSLKHFLTCPTSDAKAWKAGKRLAEKDEATGGQFFKTVAQDVPCPKNSDKEIETFSSVVREMSAVLRKNQDITLTHADRMRTGFSREFSNIGASMKRLSETFSKGVQANGDAVKLSMALFRCGEAYEAVANTWAQQPPADQIPLYEGYKEYAGLLSQFGEGLSSCREASRKVTEIDAAETAEPAEKEAVRARRDVLHSLLLCEIAHFHKQRREDFKEMMKAYLAAQIQFYEKITQRLKEAKVEFDNLPY